jgi:SAM-dependent methyltransferase
VRPLVRPGDRVLDIGAGDCRLDLLLKRDPVCDVVPVDVADGNRTDLPLTLFNGSRLPFPDDSFDVALLVFVLHHAEDPRAVLTEARRVSRRQVIVFEDVNVTWRDRLVFRGFHRWAEWSQNLTYPHHEWPPERWSRLAAEVGLYQRSSSLVGRQLGHFASRNVLFDWEKVSLPARAAA